jgi:glutathione S-transferase
MKLYMSPGACSLSPHIVLREAGIAFDLEKVDIRKKKTASGRNFLEINSKGYVPVLELDDGQRLTEGPVIVEYVADLRPQSALAPAAGSMERYRLQEWLCFITSEIHKQYAPLFHPESSEDWKQGARTKLTQRFEWVAKELADKPYLMGERFTVADAYLFTMFRWAPHVGIDLAPWPSLKTYVGRVSARPSVVEALKAEDAIKRMKVEEAA